MLLLLLLCVLAAYLAAGFLYRKYWARGLSVQIQFTEHFLFEGDGSALTEIITNDKLLPLPALEVRFAADRSLEFKGEAKANSSSTDQCYRCDVFSFLFHQQVSRTLPFTAHRRGLYRINSASATGYDFLFRRSCHLEAPQQTQLYVYPRQLDSRRISLLCQAVSGMLLSKSLLYPDPFEFSGIRDYRREDPMHHVNWKASARAGKLMVNQFASTTSISLTLLFDLEDTLILKYEDLIEETIRIVSSLAARLAKDRMPLDILGNAIEPATGEAFSMHLPADAGGSLGALNQRLACLDAAHVLPMVPLLEAEAAAKKTGHTYLFLSKNRDTALTKALHALAGPDNQILWVMPVHPADAARLQRAQGRGITVFPWEAI